mmetsp:Transcript_69333/g.180610  ORF Transcript_69333/g.180610 Transcript_69333/m.180610 type:complete len:211 (-) Transcript_69333:208-840(-)
MRSAPGMSQWPTRTPRMALWRQAGFSAHASKTASASCTRRSTPRAPISAQFMALVGAMPCPCASCKTCNTDAALARCAGSLSTASTTRSVRRPHCPSAASSSGTIDCSTASRTRPCSSPSGAADGVASPAARHWGATVRRCRRAAWRSEAASAARRSLTPARKAAASSLADAVPLRSPTSFTSGDAFVLMLPLTPFLGLAFAPNPPKRKV